MGTDREPKGRRIDPKTRRQLPDGVRYRDDRGKYQVRVWTIGLNGSQVERSFLVDSLAEAKRLRAGSSARAHPGGNLTLEEWHHRYWPVIDGSVRPSTVRAYERGWRLRVKPWLGHKKLETISAGDVEEAMQQWSGTASTRIDALSVLSRLLDGATRSQLVPINVARLVRRPRQEEPAELRSRALTASEVQLLLSAIDSDHHRAYLAALVYTGMRANEATALRVGDVDLNARAIHVHRSLTVGADGKMLETRPKSHKSRVVPIATPLLPHLLGSMDGKGRDDHVFTGPKGGILSTSNVRRAVRWSEVRAGLDRPDLRLHDLRHTFATLLFDAGTAANDVQAMLGHSSMQMTERYSRARADVAMRAAQAIDGLFGVTAAPTVQLQELKARPWDTSNTTGQERP